MNIYWERSKLSKLQSCARAIASSCTTRLDRLVSVVLAILFLQFVAAAHASTKTFNAMGTSPCSWSVPIQDKDHKLDVAATIRLLRTNHFTCYVQPIEEKPPMSLDDFKRLLPAAQASGIAVWPVLIPHTEGVSLPYREDFVRWIKELAELSLKYSVIHGINIDDIDAGGNDKMFTHSYLCQIYRTEQDINPRLLFIPTIYDLDREEVGRLTGCVDGVWLWWTNLEQNNGLRAFLRNGRLVANGRFPVYAGIYAHATSWQKQAGPKPGVFRKAMELGCTYSDGVVMWQLPLTDDPKDNMLLPVAKDFAAEGSSTFAGKCGKNPI